MQPIEAALAALESLEPGEIPNFTVTAKEYGVDRTTLSRRYCGVQHSREDQYANQQLLNPTQERTLLKYINDLTDKGLPPSHEMIRNFTQEIGGRCPGKQWSYRFVERNSSHICTGWTNSMDRCHKRADSAVKYTLYWYRSLSNIRLIHVKYIIWMKRVFLSEF
jgi:hypothetical protein